MGAPIVARTPGAADQPTAPDAVPLLARPIVAKQLRQLAKDVRRISTHYGVSPERLLADKDEIANRLNDIARMLDGGAS